MFGQQPQQGGYGMPQQGGFGGMQQGFGGGFGGMQQGFGGYGPGISNYSAPQRPQQPGMGGGMSPQFAQNLGAILAGGTPQQPQMPQQLGGQPGGMDPRMDPRMQLTGLQFMGGQLPNGGRMDMSQQPSQQQERQFNDQMRTASMNMLPQYGGDQSNPAYLAAMQQQDAQLRSQMGMGGQPEYMQQGDAMGMPNQQQAEAFRQFQQSEALMGANMPRQQPQPQQMGSRNPYSQQMRQEDPRMAAMRNMQRMRFGGGRGYNF
jgi:hypothetical protein